MSVAESLLLQRASIPVVPKFAPSIIHSGRDASKIPLSDQASLAHNSLSLLSTVDERFPDFASPLLLHDPLPRQSLSPQLQQSLSDAIITTAHHLSPIFPVRHAQRVYEWIVNGLHTGLFGNEKEIDALLISSLPFHSTNQFQVFVKAVVVPRPRKNWKWLLPIVQSSSKYPSSEFIIKYSPPIIHQKAIDFAVRVAKDNIPTTYAASFITNITARWIVTEASFSKRRMIVLSCLKAISSLFSTPPEFSSEVICALLIVCASAVVAGIESDVASAVGNASVATIIKLSDHVAETAVGSLAVVFKYFGSGCLFRNSAKNLLRKRKGHLLMKIGDYAPTLYCHIVRCAIIDGGGDDGDFFDDVTLRAMKEAFTGEGVTIMTQDFVTEAVSKILDICSPSVVKQDEDVPMNDVKSKRNQSIYETLVEILMPLARGRFATAVDLGLRKHFDSRKMKKDSSQYEFVDKVLAAALHGTSFEIIKSQTGDDAFEANGMMILSALDHPEWSVRKHALERIFKMTETDDDSDLSKVSEELQEKVLSIVEHESVGKVALSACECALKFSSFSKPDILIKAVGVKLLSFVHRLNEGSRKLDLNNAQRARKYLNCLCLEWIGNESQAVLALLFGSVIHGVFDDDEDMLKSAAVNLMRLLKQKRKEFRAEIEVIKKSDEMNADILVVVTELLASNAAFNHITFLEWIHQWKPSWIFKVITSWATVCSQADDMNLTTKVLEASVASLSKFTDVSRKQEFVETILTICDAYCVQFERNGLQEKFAMSLWCLSAAKLNDGSCGKVLEVFFEKMGEDTTMKILQKAFRKQNERLVKTVSFKWYVHFACLRDSRKQECVDGLLELMKVCYGDDVILRQEGKQICKWCSSVSSKKSSPFSKYHAVFFRGMSKTTGDSFIVEKNDAVSRIVIDELMSNVKHQMLKNDIPTPLYRDENGNGKIDEFSFVFKSMNGEMKVTDIVPVLRAVFNHQSNGRGTNFLKSLWLSLKSLLNELSNDENDLVVEGIARIAILLANSNAKKTSLKIENVSSCLGTILSLLKKSLSDEEGDWKKRFVQTTLIGAGIQLLQVIRRHPGSAAADVTSFVEFLLALSSRSSTVGEFSREILDISLGSLFPFRILEDPLANMAHHFQVTAKRRKAGPADDIESSLAVTTETFSDYNVSLGALETVGRWCRSQKKSLYSAMQKSSARASLWNFIKSVTDKLEADKTILGGDREFVLRLCLDTLGSLYKSEEEKTTSGDDVSLTVVAGLLFYPGRVSEESEEEETVSIAAIRTSALNLVEVLAPSFEKELECIAADVITSLLKGKSIQRSSDSLNILIPCLVAGGTEFAVIAKWLCGAAFSSQISNDRDGRTHRMEMRNLLASLCQFAPVVDLAVKVCLSNMVRLLEENLIKMELGRECCHFLKVANLNVMQDLKVISSVAEFVRCKLAAEYLMDATFMDKLFKTLHTTNNENGTEIEKEVMESYSNMVVSIAKCKEGSEREVAIGTAMGILPISGFRVCLEHALKNEDLKARTKVILSASSRLEDFDTPFSVNWKLATSFIVDNRETKQEENWRKKQEQLLLCSVLQCMRDVMSLEMEEKVTLSTNDRSSMVGLKQAALKCVESLIKRFGVRDVEVSMQCASDVMELLDEAMLNAIGSVKERHTDDYRRLVSVALKCLATVVITFGNTAVAIVPQLLNSAVTLIEWAFGPESEELADNIVGNGNGLPKMKRKRKDEKKISATEVMTEVGIRTCVSMIEHVSLFFGEKSLQRLTSLVMMNKDAKVLEDVLKVGMQELLSSSVVAAVSSAVEQLSENRACAYGIGVVMDCVRNGLYAMKKNAVKMEAKSLLGITLKCLEYGRGEYNEKVGYPVGSMKGGNSEKKDKINFKYDDNTRDNTGEDLVTSEMKLVDEKCVDMLTALTLKLPESEFKILYDGLSQWCGDGKIPSEATQACATMRIPLLQIDLLRAMPFYRLCLKLFDHLEAIMVPYFVQQLEQVMEIISNQNLREELVKVKKKNEKNRNIKDSSKKRSRRDVDKDEAEMICMRYANMQFDLQNICMNGLTKMLNQKSSLKMLNAEVVVKIQDGLMNCFDERLGDSEECEFVIKSLCALCVRICGMRGTADESREESRELINGLSRQMLMRTKEDVISIRQGALIASSRIAEAVGDDYLVTLPETMPLMAEVVDDEDGGVRKAARAFVGVMEGMAGESLMDQLK